MVVLREKLITHSIYECEACSNELLIVKDDEVQCFLCETVLGRLGKLFRQRELTDGSVGYLAEYYKPKDIVESDYNIDDWTLVGDVYSNVSKSKVCGIYLCYCCGLVTEDPLQICEICKFKGPMGKYYIKSQGSEIALICKVCGMIHAAYRDKVSNDILDKVMKKVCVNCKSRVGNTVEKGKYGKDYNGKIFNGLVVEEVKSLLFCKVRCLDCGQFIIDSLIRVIDGEVMCGSCNNVDKWNQETIKLRERELKSIFLGRLFNTNIDVFEDKDILLIGEEVDGYRRAYCIEHDKYLVLSKHDITYFDHERCKSLKTRRLFNR